MKERPILFSAPMVRAILDGTKTQTRRVANKLVRHPDLGNLYTPGALVLEHEPQHVIDRACPYGQPGDRLWVREAWRTVAEADPIPPRDMDEAFRLWFEVDAPHQPGAGKYRPPMFMPHWASRSTLEITGVRVEQLQDISETDCIAEGIEKTAHGFWSTYGQSAVNGTYSPRTSYRMLWQSINGPDSWVANPWVWVVEFKRI